MNLQYSAYYTGLEGARNVADGVWHHIAGVNIAANGGSAADIRLYVDGALEILTTNGNTLGANSIQNTTPVTIGSRAGGGCPFTGIIDEPRVSTVARSSNWVWAEYMNTASNTPVFQTYGAAILSGSAPVVGNLPVTNVVSGAACLNGQIEFTNGAPVIAVSVYWGPTDGGTNADLWANTNVFTGSLWNQGDVLTTNITLPAGQDFFYTYSASNANGCAMATPSASFSEGALTLAAADAVCGASLTDTATVVVSRPANCTNHTWTVYYTTSGSAVNGVDYTASPASGSLTIPVGQTSATITITPLLLNPGTPKNFTVSLAAGSYLIGSPGSAACTYGGAGGWANKAPITFSGYNRAETLTNFPALVVLGTNIFNFAYNQFQSGSNDLAFTADATGLTNLYYEIDKWNTNGLSYVWVQVPLLASNTTITAWWGASGQVQPACTTNGATWTNGYVGVWHLPNGTLLTANDSTTSRQNGSIGSGATAATGEIGGGASFDGTANGYVNMGTFNPLPTGLGTASIWVNWNSSAINVNNFAMAKGADYGSGNSWGINLIVADASTCGVYFYYDPSGNPYGSHATVASGTGVWHQVTVVMSPNTQAIYFDGVLVVTDSNGTSIPNSGNQFNIGKTDRGSPYDYAFNGLLDEARVATAQRSANWVWAEYMNMASNMVFCQYGHASATETVPSTFSISGTITDQSIQVGGITYICLTTNATVAWDYTCVATNNPYSFTNLTANQSYRVLACRFVNSNSVFSADLNHPTGFSCWDPYGTYAGNPVLLTDDVANADIVITDPQDSDGDGIPDAAELAGWNFPVAWGDDRQGESMTRVDLLNSIAVSAGGYHSLALLANGHVAGWGNNFFGQCNVPPMSPTPWQSPPVAATTSAIPVATMAVTAWPCWPMAKLSAGAGMARTSAMFPPTWRPGM